MANVGKGTCIDTTSTNAIDTLHQHIMHLDFYQLLIFLDSANNNSNNKFGNYDLLEKIIGKNPAIVIDLNRMASRASDAFKTRQPTYQRQSSLLIIIQRNFNSDNLMAVLDFHVGLLFKGMRPRCLIICDDRALTRMSIEMSLHEAWRKKFLDVSVISLDIAEILNYNPFSDTYNWEPYAAEVDLFPDKLRDMKGYNLHVPFIDSEPDMFVEQIVDNITGYGGSGFTIIKFVAYALNFHVNVATESDTFASAIDQLKAARLNIMCFPLFITESLINEKLEIGQIHSFETYRAMITPRTTLLISVSFMTFLPFALSVLVVFLSTYAINLTRKHLPVFDILRMVFGQPALKPPKRLPERIVFITIAILSIIFLPTIIAKITGVVVSRQPPPIASFKDAINAQLQPYAFHGLLELLSNDEDKYASLIMSSIILYNDTDYCLKLLLTSKERTMCFTPETQAQMYANKYRKADGGPIIKLTDLRVSLMAEGLIYEEGSPFVDKFNEVVQTIVESGVWVLWGPKYPKLQSMDREESSFDANDRIDSVQLSIMYVCGCIFATFVFVAEILVAHFKLPR